MPTEGRNLFNPWELSYNLVNDSLLSVTDSIQSATIRINALGDTYLSYQPLSDEEIKKMQKEKEIQELKDEFNNFTYFLEHRVH